MQKLIRYSIAAVAASVAVGGVGAVAVSARADQPGTDQGDQQTIVKREDTATSWDAPALDDDNGDDDGANLKSDDSPTHHSTLTNSSVNTNNSANTKDSINTKNSVNTKNSINTKNSGQN